MKTTDERFNEERRNVLKLMDEEGMGAIPASTLGLLGLTPYLSQRPVEFDASLADLVVRYKESQRPVLHLGVSSGFFFAPPQEKALSFIEDHGRSLIMAPTSFGKTLLIKEYIFRHKPHSVAIIVPTNALGYELQTDFKQNKYAFGDYAIFDKSMSPDSPERDNKPLLFIGTQEKYLELERIFETLDFFVIDEAYKLEERLANDRCYRLSDSFLRAAANKARKMCLLTPNAELIGLEEYGFATFSTTFNLVEKWFIRASNEDDFYRSLNEVSASEKTILFCETPNDIAKVYGKISPRQPIDQTFIDSLEQDFHPEWSVVKFLKNGVLTHSGAMPKYVQNRMINLFNNSEHCNLLIGTNSISEGINTPTKNLFIHPEFPIRKRKLLVKNTVGRAGRLGQYPLGHIYSVDDVEAVLSEGIQLKISISDEEQISIINDTAQTDKIAEVAERHKLNVSFCQRLIGNRHISLAKFEAILNAVKGNQAYDSFERIADIYNEVRHEEDRRFHYNDRYLLKALLQGKYYPNWVSRQNTGQPVYIHTYQQRLECYRRKSGEDKTDSEIIDALIKMLYTTLDYELLPFAQIIMEIYDANPNWKFGDNVVDITKEFLRRYYLFIYGDENVLSMSENSPTKAIYSSLRELGINLRTVSLTPSVLSEIANELGARYSQFDVGNAIKRLAKGEGPNKVFYESIVIKYLGRS